MIDDLERRLREATALDAATASDREWTDLLAVSLDALPEIARLRAENEALREAVKIALTCTPSARNGEVIYDCGNPWEILSTALKGSRHE